jgi:hypothetical protein
MGDDMSNTNRTIRIVGVPPGEAPFWVREQWVGLELPLTRHPAPRAFYAFGVLSSPRTWLPQLWEIVRGRVARIQGSPVDPSERSIFSRHRARRPRRGGEKIHLI